MKQFFSVFICSFLLGNIAFAQNQFQVLPDKNGGKIFKGIISREALQSDTSFTWYAQNLKGYSPDPVALAGLVKMPILWNC